MELTFNIKLLLILLIVGNIVYVISKHFTIGVIRGDSMLPTYHNWTPILIKKKRFAINVGDCYVFKADDETIVIKRLTELRVNPMNGKSFLWMQGDNEKDSRDSRDYGYVEVKSLIGKVVKFGGK